MDPQRQTLPFTRHNPSVEWVRDAMAINERRTMFNPLPWVMDALAPLHASMNFALKVLEYLRRRVPETS